MGILNVTPDSFSDGGMHDDVDDAVDAALRMVDEGADIIDVGGESTRPGSDPVSEEEEIRRVVPVIERLSVLGMRISIDTMKAEVARLALQAGASIVNDVSALRAEGMVELCAEAGCTVCLMHMQGQPKTMQLEPTYRDVVSEVRDFLRIRAAEVQASGVAPDKIWIDPGIGFGKTTEHNLTLLRQLKELVKLPYPVLIGASRKAFIGRVLGSHDDPLPTLERLEGTLAVQVLAQASGARIIRTHEVKESRRSMDLAAAILGEPQS
jgi:dihydropteroate synthase